MKKIVLMVALFYIGTTLTAQDLSPTQRNALFKKEVHKKLNKLERYIRNMARKDLDYGINKPQ